MRIKYPRSISVIAMLLGLSLSPGPVFPQAPFYQGKTLKIINNDPGGTAAVGPPGANPSVPQQWST